MADRYPGYDVLAKRDTPSWNDATRDAIDRRLALTESRTLNARQKRTLAAICDRIAPQPAGRAHVNTAAIVGAKIDADAGDGYRAPDMPRLRAAWTTGLDAIEAEASATHGRSFTDLAHDAQDALLEACEAGELTGAAWNGMPPASFFSARIVNDVVAAYYAHPSAMSAIGFGGPASPRGYVRLDADKRDPWEAVEAKPGESTTKAKAKNARIG